MPLIRNILGAIRSAWSHRSRAVKPTRRHTLSGVDHLDDRQLLTVSFTGNVINDFPAATGPGVKFLTGGPIQQPTIPPSLQSLISVTGWNQEGIAFSYDPNADTLSVGILQPDNGKTGQRIIAGDADNNLNSGTVDPAVIAIDPSFQDIADLGQSEHMFAYLDLNNDGTPDIVAGIDGFSANKNYQVALAVPNPTPTNPPSFGAEIPGHAGNIFLVNDPRHPAMEFNITNFKTLFRQFNGGQDPVPTSVMTGASNGGSAQDSLGEGIYFPQAFNWNDVNPATDLAIQKYAAPSPVRGGESLIYTLFVKNNGPFLDSAVTVTDAIPAGVTVISATPSQGTASLTPTGFTADLGAIAAGGSAAITVVVQPAVSLEGTSITNTSTVTGSIRDTDPTNNTSSVTTPVIGPDSCPPILVNPHHSGLIYTNPNTRTLIRVNVYGTKDFDVTKIDPATVNLDGATPVGDFVNRINGDQFKDRTFLFRGNDPAFSKLPQAFTSVTLHGATTTGGVFDPQAIVFNVNQGVFTPELARKYQTGIGQAALEARKVSPKYPLAQVLYDPANTFGLYGTALNPSQTVRIPGVKGLHQPTPVLTGTDNNGVVLGSSTVRIPISNGFGSPVVVNNASHAGAARTRGTGLNPNKTVKINHTAQAGGKVRANVAMNLNDFAMSS